MVERVEPHPLGDAFDAPADRYGLEDERPVADAEPRAVIVMKPTHTTR